MTTFPSNGDYVEALQNTGTCFQDQDLKAGRVDLTPLGIPKAISGNFASVFSITGSSGKRYAVKCFTKQVTGQHRRYQAIHGILANMARPWQVGFEYIEKGVLVRGQWHAILRMEWVEGSQTLIPWLTQSLGHPDRIIQVANQFADCVADLHAAGIAHGDLQHGNLLIDTHHRLRVIDYDGMFVPSIKDLGSNELGLANYQHPRRSRSDFGPELDRFSAWLIYGSLLSLAAQPTLWYSFRQEGDEKLLLGKEEFEPPLDVIGRMRSLGSPHTEFADVLREALAPSSSPATVPEFDRKRIPHPEITRIEPKVADPLANSQAWWRQAAAAPADGTSASGQPERTPRVGTGWLRSHQAPLPPIEVVRPSRASKLIGLLLIAMGLLSAAALGTLSNLLLGGLVLLMWGAAMMTGAWVLWNRTDPVVKRSAARRQVKLARRELDRQEARVAEARNARSSLDGKERRDLQALESRRSKLPKSATDEYERKSKDLRKSVTALQDALKRLDAAKAAELRQQLKASQEKHIQNYLASRLIKPGVIHGIGPAMVAALAANGIHTAADLAAVSGTQFRRTGSSYWFTISGIGPAKAAAIHSWHQLQLTAAQSRAPQWLSSTQTKAIETKFADEKRTTQAAIDAVGPKLHALKTAIDAKYTAEDQEITQKIELVRLDYRHRRSAADATVAQVVTQLQKLEDELSDAQRNLDRYQSVSFLKYLSA